MFQQMCLAIIAQVGFIGLLAIPALGFCGLCVVFHCVAGRIGEC